MLRIADIPENSCFGCGACVAVCSTGALSMRIDSWGFLRVNITESHCNACGMCLKVCPIAVRIPANRMRFPVIYASWSDSPEVRTVASSGGVALSISLELIKSSYVVCAAMFDREFRTVYHSLAAHPRSVLRMTGSKYIQSDFSTALKEIIDTKPKKVLLVGTPCQIHAARNVFRVMNIHDSDFYLMDFHCHGVPSYLLWWSFLDSVYPETGRPVHVNFRFKVTSWEDFHCRIVGEKGVHSTLHRDSIFYQFYLANYFLRASCYRCLLTSTSSADLRLGDFWGRMFKGDKLGVSIAVPFTEKGIHLIESNSDLVVQSLPVAEWHVSQHRVKKQVLRIPSDNNIAFKAIRNGVDIRTIYKKHLRLKMLARKVKRLPNDILRMLISGHYESVGAFIRRVTSRGWSP